METPNDNLYAVPDSSSTMEGLEPFWPTPLSDINHPFGEDLMSFPNMLPNASGSGVALPSLVQPQPNANDVPIILGGDSVDNEIANTDSLRPRRNSSVRAVPGNAKKERNRDAQARRRRKIKEQLDQAMQAEADLKLSDKNVKHLQLALNICLASMIRQSEGLRKGVALDLSTEIHMARTALEVTGADVSNLAVPEDI